MKILSNLSLVSRLVLMTLILYWMKNKQRNKSKALSKSNCVKSNAVDIVEIGQTVWSNYIELGQIRSD